MKTTLTANLTTGAVTIGDEPWTPPAFGFGESLTLAFILQTLDAAGNVTEPSLDIRETIAAAGAIDGRPTSGTFCLQVGDGAQTSDNTTEALQHNCTAAELKAAINALPAVVDAYGTAAVSKTVDGSWLITWGAGAAAVPFQLRDNKMLPISRGTRAVATIDEVQVHELRMEQLPVAFSDVASRVLPPAPTVATVRDGGALESGDGKYSEIQSLTIAPDFRGSYYLADSTGARTSALSRDDTADVIQAALEAMLGKGNILVTLADNFVFHVEFVGELIGINRDLLTATALAPPPGYLTLTIDFTRGELLRALRASATGSTQAPFQVWIQVADAVEGGEILSWKKVVSQLVTFQRPLVWPDLATVQEIDWLQPPSPASYRAFSRDTVTDGYQFFPVLLGDGAATEFTVAHMLDTAAIHVAVWENTDGGRLLINGTDYRVNRTTGAGTNSLKITALTGAPANEGWYAVLFSNKTVSQFADGLTIEQDQVTGLSDLIASLSATVATLSAQAATIPLGVALPDADSGGGGSIRIDDQAGLIAGGDTELNGLEVVVDDLTPGALLPALHTATVTSITSGGLPTIADAAGHVYQNNTGGALIVPGGYGSPSSIAAVGDYVAGDGRRVYPVSKYLATKSYFPRDFERELPSFPITADMLWVGRTLKLRGLLSVQTFLATSRVKCQFIVEWGAVSSDASPSTTADNLAAITWNATPILTQPILIDKNRVSHPLGVDVVRKADGTLAANKIHYGKASGGDSVPSSPTFELRARLINFDTENGATNARGVVYWRFENVTAILE